MSDTAIRALFFVLSGFLLLFGILIAILTSPVFIILVLLVEAILIMVIRMRKPELFQAIFPARQQKAEVSGEDHTSFHAEMVLERSDDPSVCIRIDRPSFLLGRGRECDFRIDNGTVSRKHCRILWDASSHLYYVEDVGSSGQGSSGGTYVNQERLIVGEKKILTEGSMLRMSDISFFFRKEK